MNHFSKVRPRLRDTYADTLCLEMNPPAYDIDQYSPVHVTADGESRSIDLAQSLARTIEMDGDRYRQDSELLPPEIVFRDVIYFETSMGNGFSTLLNYSDGMEIFTRALNALPQIEAPKQCDLLIQARDIAVKNGVSFPESVPEDWGDDAELGYELCQKIDEETLKLDEQYWSTFGSQEHDIYLACLKFIQNHSEELRVRKPNGA